jgi:hypothetical protein
MFDKTQIKEHMEVVDQNGQHVGIVDEMDGDDKIKLTKSDPASDGQHHWIAVSSIGSVSDKVQLNCPASSAYVA